MRGYFYPVKDHLKDNIQVWTSSPDLVRRGPLALLLIAFILTPFDTQKPFETKPTLTAASNYQWSQDDNAEFNTGTHSSTLADSNTVKLDKGDWWNDNWNYRKQLTITNASSNDWAANTTVQVTIDTKSFYDAGQLQADCDDLRIVYLTGGTNTELPRYYDIAQGATNCSDSEATIVYFPLQSSISNGQSSTSYYLYYGNSSANTLSNPDNAFDIGSKDALLACPFHGDTTCAAGETPSAATGAIRYSGGKSALSFDGDDAYVILPGGVFNQDSGSWELWVYSNFSAQAANNIRTLSLGFLRTAGHLLYFRNVSGDTNHFSFGSFTDNTWNHLAVTWAYDSDADETLLQTYLNGSYTNQGTTSGKLNISGGMNLARYGSYYARIITDELVIYNRALEESEIAAHYNSGNPAPIVPDSSTVGLWHFDENGDDPRNSGKAIDSSGNGNHGTINGAKYVSGLVGVNSSTSDTGNVTSQSYAGHSGVFVEEGTTNKITNPSFDHSTFDTNWNVETQPDDVSGLQLWLKADAGLYQDAACSTAVDTDGQTIGCWQDQSGNGNDATQSTADNEPTYKEDILNGEPVARFDGGNDLMSASLGTLNSPITILVVGYFANASQPSGNYDYFYSIGPAGGADTHMSLARWGGAGDNRDKYYLYDGSATLYGPVLSGQTWMITSQIHNSSAVYHKLWIDGTSQTVTDNTAGLSTGGTLGVGVYRPEASPMHFLDGDIAEVIIYNSALSSTQRQAIEQYLSSKYDISLSSGTNPGLTENTTAPYYKFGNKSAKVVADADLNLTTSVNPGNTNTHTLSAYVFDATTGNEGGTVDNTIAQLVWEGSAQSGGTYTDMGGGWWRIDYSAATTNSANNYGVQVKSGKTVYVDGVQLEEKAYTTTYTDGTLGTGYSWSGTAHESTSSRTATNVNYSTSGNLSTSAGTVSLWAKINTIGNKGANCDSTLVGHYQSGGGHWNYVILYFDENGVSGMYVGDTSDTGLTYSAGNWYHIVLTWSGTNYEWWINNSSQGSGSFSGLVALNSIFYLGRYGSGYYADSTISDLRIYDSALSTDEVADLYYSGLTYHQSEAAANPYPSSGTFTSSVLDTSNPNVTYKTVTWDQTTPANTAISVDVRSAQNSTMTLNPTAWTNVTNGSNIPSLLDDKRFIQYRANLTTSDQFNTPTFGNLNIVYEVAPNDPTNFTGTVLSTSSIQWSWNDTSDNEDEYYVEDESGTRVSSDLGINASSWTETGLSPNTLYTRHVSAVNATGEEESIDVSVYTLANTPGETSVEQTGWTAQGWTTLKVTVDSSGNPDYTQFAIYETQTGKYVQADGTLGDLPVWQTYEQWGGAGGFLVSGLTAAEAYNFQVKARNGDGLETVLSSSVSSYTYGNVYEGETTCQTYTVQPGDTLVSIAQDIFGDWTRYLELVELNKDRYPSLQTNVSYLEVGWELVVSCQLLVDREEDDEDKESEEKSEEDTSTIEAVRDEDGRYTVKVKVIDTEENPIRGAKVTMYSDPKEGVTDDKGETIFEKVEAGEHRILVAYQGRKGEQEIDLEGDSEEIRVTVQLEGTSMFSWILVVTVVILILIIGLLLFKLIVNSKQNV